MINKYAASSSLLLHIPRRDLTAYLSCDKAKRCVPVLCGALPDDRQHSGNREGDGRVEGLRRPGNGPQVCLRNRSSKPRGAAGQRSGGECERGREKHIFTDCANISCTHTLTLKHVLCIYICMYVLMREYCALQSLGYAAPTHCLTSNVVRGCF